MQNFLRIKYYIYTLTLLCWGTISSCNGYDKDKPRIRIQTNRGDIDVELYPKQAPETVAAFLKNVEARVYKGSSFYRVLKADQLASDYNTGIIQGGPWNNPLKQNIKPAGIPHEPTSLTGLSHTNGAISMARQEPGSARTEFFICIGDQSAFDAGRTGTEDRQGFAAFGMVVSGMKVVRSIQNQPSSGDRFVKSTGIINIRKL